MEIKSAHLFLSNFHPKFLQLRQRVVLSPDLTRFPVFLVFPWSEGGF